MTKELWSDAKRGNESYVFYKASRLNPGPTQYPSQWTPENFCLVINLQWPEDDCLSPWSGVVEKGWSYTSIPTCLTDVHRDNLLTSTIFQCIRNCFTCNDIYVNRNVATVILFGLQVLLGS